MALLPGLQEPAAPTAPQQDPIVPQGPTLGQRGTDWFKNRYLPYAEPDPYLQTLTLDAMRTRAQKGPEALKGLDAYKPEDKASVLMHMAAFDKNLHDAESEPMRAPTIFRETGGDKRLFEIASKPGGLQMLADLSKQANDEETYRRAEDALNMANLAKVGQITMAGSTQDPEGVAGLAALAQGGADWGAEITKPLTPGEIFGSPPPWPHSGSMAQRMDTQAEYQAFAYQFTTNLAKGAARLGIDYKAPGAAPQTAKEARQMFLDALPIAQQVQEKVIGRQASELALYGPEKARATMGLYAKLLFAVQEKMPEKGADLNEIQAILNAYAAGEQASGPMAEVAMAALKPAFWVLEKMGRLDQAVGALLYGNVGEVRPTGFKFADGAEFSDILAAAEYSQKIVERGGEYRSPQWLVDASADSRFSALKDEAIAAEFPLPGQKDAGFFSTAGRAVQGGVALMQEGLRRAGDAVFGGEAPIDPQMAARPVVTYGLTVQPEGGGPDFSKIGAALSEGEGQFIGEAIRENTSTKADTDVPYRIAGWTLAEVPAVALSPWNAVHTGQVRAPDGTPRVYHFTDGRQMNGTWAGVRENVAEALGAGGKGDIGGSGDIADVILTQIRDTPGQSLDEAAVALKNTPQFLDQVGFLAEQSGLAPWLNLKAAGMSHAEYAAARSRKVAELLDEGLTKSKSLIEQAPLTMGYKDFWSSPSQRAWKMEARRGLYFGPIGVPLGPISQRVTTAVGAGVRAVEEAKGLGKIVAPFSALKRASQSVFFGSHVATGTAVPGMMNALPEAIRIPHRMKKSFERYYRLQAATLDARSQMSTYGLLEEAGTLPSEQNRKLITLMAEGGRTIQDQAAYLVEHASTYGDTIGWRPGGETPTQKFASALAKARELFPATTRVQQHLDQTFRELQRIGILDDREAIKNYVTHFFHGPAGAKSLKQTDEFVAELEKVRAQSLVNPTQIDRGTTALPRLGPVSIVEALRHGGFDPEMDIAKLLHFRTTQALKAELDGAFMARISQTLGVPMLRGKEAAVRLIQSVRGTERWGAELGFSQGVLTREAYNKDLLKISRMIRDKTADMERTRLADLAQELGVPISKFHDEQMLLGSMLESEKFLRRASGKLKSGLDKMMTPEARDALRSMSRDMLAHRTAMQNSMKDLKSLGVTLPDLVNLSDAELALAGQRAMQSFQTRTASVASIEKDLRVAKEALRGTTAEAKAQGKKLSEMATEAKRLTAEREKIAQKWNKAKDAAKEAGLVGDDLSQASDLSAVRRVKDAPGQDIAFEGYKEQQRAYVANAQAQKRLRDQMAYERGEANRMSSYLAKAQGRVAAHENAIKGTKAQARDLAKRGGAAQVRARLIRGDFEEAAQAFLDSSRAYSEARRGLEAVLGSGQAHGVARALRASAARLAAHGQNVRGALAAFESKHGVSAHMVRQRAMTPRTIKGATGALRRREAALAAPPDPSKRAYLPHSPAQSQADLVEYARAQDALDALEMSRSEQSALLWEVFGARTLTEVPLHELRVLTDSSGSMRASIVHFITDPLGDATRKASRAMDVGPDSAAVRIGRALDASLTGTGEQIQENIERALTKVIKDAEGGSERAQKILGAIAPADLSRLYRYNDIGHAAREVVGKNEDIRKWAATMTSNARGSLERQLRTTFIPLEIGLAMKTLMGEGVFKASEAAKISLATQFANHVAGILLKVAPVTRGFKTAAIGYRASLLPGRRNSLFDGVRSMIQLGAWSFFSPSSRKSFLADIASPSGQIQTATGLVDRHTFHRIWEERGSAMFGAMADGLDDISRTLNNAIKDAKSKRFTEELEAVGREGRRTKGINLPAGAVKSAGAGGALGAALADDMASGGALGFGLYGFIAGSTGTRRVVHSSGQIASGAEWAFPVGPQAMERLDNRFRKYIYWTYVKSGMAPADAMDLMLTRMRDMTNLTPAERKIVQHLATVVPATMFYNFTKQNGIAQLVRFLDNPAPTVALLRTFRDISEDYGQDPETRAFWQNITDTIVREGKAWNMQDETTAALQLLAPVTGFLEGVQEGRPLSGFAQGVMNLGAGQDSAPIWKVILGQAEDISLPLPLASKILDRYGPFNAGGMRAYINEQGVPRVEVAGPMAAIVSLTAATVALNDVGRLQTHAAKEDWLYAVTEALGMGRIYDQQSEAEMDINRFNETEKKAMQVSDWLEASGMTGQTALDAIGLTPEEKAVAEEMLRYHNGKYISEQIGALRSQFQALKGKNRKALAGQNPERN